MTDSDTRTGTWKRIPGAGHYKACDAGGRIWSDFTDKELTPKRTGTSRYWQVKYTGDDGKQYTRPVGVLVLLAHRGLPRPGQQCCHADDNPDNNDLSNLRWDWPRANVEDRMRNSPAKPKPLKVCILCQGTFDGNGRRCRPCQMDLGTTTALRLVAGEDLEAIQADLGYPTAAGLHKLAVKYGGLRHFVAAVERQPGDTPSRLRRVIIRWKAWLADSDAQ